MPTRALSASASEVDAVMRASRVLGGIVAESLVQAGDAITMPQLRALVLVATRSDINASAIAAALDIHPSNATRLLDRLVQAGLLDRRDAVADRRNVELSLTKDGARLVSAVMEHRRQAFERILSRMGTTERQRLARALRDFADAAGEPDEPGLSLL